MPTPETYLVASFLNVQVSKQNDQRVIYESPGKQRNEIYLGSVFTPF